MISRIQLAKEWGLPVRRVHEIAKQINELYIMDVQPSSKDYLWHGVVWHYDEKLRGPAIAISTRQGFEHASDAAKHINELMDYYPAAGLKEIPQDWPDNVLKVLNKLDPDKCKHLTSYKIHPRLHQPISSYHRG